LIACDVLKLRTAVVRVVDDANDVIKWINNHTRASGLLQQHMIERTGTSLVLVLPATIRWTSHYQSCARLCEVGDSLRSLVTAPALRAQFLLAAGSRAKQKSEAERVLQIVEREDFWQQARW
jgi:hypothetical protein